MHAPEVDKTEKGHLPYGTRRVFNKLPKYHKKILLGDFNAKVQKEDIFK
jgi:hypothetical protein